MTLSSPTGAATLGTQSSTTLTIVDDDFTASISGRVLLEGGAALQGATVASNEAAIGDPWTTVTFTPTQAKSFYRTVSP